MRSDPDRALAGLTVVILYNDVPDDADPSDQDVLVQADSVGEALESLGCTVVRQPCTLDLEAARVALQQRKLDVVFNLVESLGGSDRLMPLAPALLDVLGIPFTGSPTDALFTAGDKLRTKSILRQGGLPFPAWIEPSSSTQDPVRESGLAGREREKPRFPGLYIIKTQHEHASFGIDDSAVVQAGCLEDLLQILDDRTHRLFKPCFAEQFVDGREFNLSVLASPDGPEVLPPAEILFTSFPPGKPRIVGYQAKWSADSFEYIGTPRRFDFPPQDAALLERLTSLARRAWLLFGLRGYARVDFRVDSDGEPWILEINPNPCLSPDAGFAAALNQAGIDFGEAIRRILVDALSKVAGKAVGTGHQVKA